MLQWQQNPEEKGIKVLDTSTLHHAVTDWLTMPVCPISPTMHAMWDVQQFNIACPNLKSITDQPVRST